jgi:glycosyltransferase involved in cell wall biosynthesis
MGDSGSTAIGLVLGFLALDFYSVSRLTPERFLFPLILAGLPLVDLVFAIVRRLRSGSSPMQGDRRHFFDLLLQRGQTPRHVALCCYTITVLLFFVSNILLAVSGMVAAALVTAFSIIVLLVGNKMGSLRAESLKRHEHGLHDKIPDRRQLVPDSAVQRNGSAMRICYLSSLGCELRSASAVRSPGSPSLGSRLFYRQCLYLAALGHHVTLICPAGKRETIRKVAIRKYFSRNGALWRLLCSPLIIVPALRANADLYHVHSIQLIPVGLFLKLVFRKRIVYDSFEDFPSMILLKSKVPSSLRVSLSRLVYHVEQIAGDVFDGIVTADPAVMRMYHSVRAKKLVYYNFPCLDLFRQGESASSPKEYDIVYSGGISERAGSFVLLMAIRRLADTGLRARVLIFGYSDNSDVVRRLKAEACKLKIDNCLCIRGPVRPEEVPRLLRLAKIGVVPLQPIPKFMKNIPSKLFEYWACGLATVAGDLPPIRPFFRNCEYGFRVNPTDPDAYAEAFSRLLRNPAELELMGRRAKLAVATRLNSHREGARLIDLYQRILGQRSNGSDSEEENFLLRVHNRDLHIC